MPWSDARALSGDRGGAASGVAGAARAADDYPTKPIKLIVPAAPGGPTDVPARIASQILQAKLGQPAVVENRPGAGGALGARVVAASPPDGYTLLVGNTSVLAVIPAVSASAGYDPVKNFVPIVRMTESFQILVVQRGLAVEDAQGVRRQRQGQSRQDQLRPHRRGRPAASRRRAVHAPERHQDDRRALSQRRRVGDRGAVQGGRHHDRGHRDHPQSHPRRQAAGARRAEQDPHAAVARHADDGRGRRAGRRGQHVLRSRGAGRHAAGDHREAQRRR